MIQTSIFDYLYPPYKTTKPIRLIELFAGVGSQAMALRDLGANFEHHRVIEIDPFAVKSYNAIHGTSFEPNDITQIHGDDLGIFDKKRYEYIMTYSFPCQDLSKAGKQAGMAKDSGTRSGLLWEVERILLELQERDELPQVLLMENVPDVIGTKNIKDFNKWYAFLESIGYQSYYKLLNAKDYGVPQSRNRCFMVSILGNYSYTFPESIPLKKKLRDVLESEVDEKYYINDEVARKFANKDDISKTIRTSGRSSLDRHSWDVIQIGNCMPTQTRDNPNHGRVYATEGLSPTLNRMGGGNRQPFICEPVCLNSKMNGKQPSLQDRIYDAEAISTAITTSFMPSIHDQGIRKLTPLECWRLMDYSDEDFYKAKAVNSNTQLYKQAGNGIVKAVLMAIFKEMMGYEDT